jgi:hypothetical protein
MSKVTDEQLKQAFDDILEWRKTGVLKEKSIIREIHSQFNKENYGGDLWQGFPVYAMESVILFEIAKRHYREDDNNV